MDRARGKIDGDVRAGQRQDLDQLEKDGWPERVITEGKLARLCKIWSASHLRIAKLRREVCLMLN